ncbi:hypothetical protein ACICHK_42355 (plasmid) [Streptomyces sp. AHU1]|uniref:hypothetical protein n=1 Tax=Streptomyces sp. AHU1 TaxID=3377215 RepID=UPI003877BA81
MNAVLQTATLGATLAAFVAAAVAAVKPQSRRFSAFVFLDLLTAAGVLHLAVVLSYASVVMTASIVAIRRLIGMSYSAIGKTAAGHRRRGHPLGGAERRR